MAGAWTTVSIKDGGGTSRTMRAWDESGTGAGPFSFASTIADLTGAGSVVIKAASTASAATDESLVTNESPNSQISATTGVTTGAAVSTDANGTLQQYLRGLVKLLAAGISVAVSNANSNGSALQANSAPVTQAPTSFRVAVTPTVTASAYVAGNVLGGVMTFASMLLPTPNAAPTKWSGILQSINVKFKAAAVTGEIDVAVFTASPAGTYTDHAAPTFNAADAAKLVGIYALSTPESTLGTMTTYNLDGIGAVIDGASTSLFVVVTVKGTPTPASTTDVIVELGVLQG